MKTHLLDGISTIIHGYKPLQTGPTHPRGKIMDAKGEKVIEKPVKPNVMGPL